jgi:anti-sigma factor RsiW
MDCRMIQGELFAYVLGAADDAARERTDAHLLSCTECLGCYLRLKHHVERGASLEARPGEHVRRRIREDVEGAVRPRGAAKVQRWLQRPIPLYQVLAVGAVAAGVALAGPWLGDAMTRRPLATEARLQQVDTSREVAQSVTIY